MEKSRGQKVSLTFHTPLFTLIHAAGNYPLNSGRRHSIFSHIGDRLRWSQFRTLISNFSPGPITGVNLTAISVKIVWYVICTCTWTYAHVNFTHLACFRLRLLYTALTIIVDLPTSTHDTQVSRLQTTHTGQFLNFSCLTEKS